MPAKEQFMAPWVGAVPNFGNFSSARAESGQSYIKECIETSTQNLFQVCEKLMLAMDTQVHNVTSSLAADQVRMVCNLPPMFSKIIRKVSFHAIVQMNKEYNKMITERDQPIGEHNPACTGAFSQSMGFPCKHFLLNLHQKSQKLRVSHFHPQWNLDYNPLNVRVNTFCSHWFLTQH